MAVTGNYIAPQSSVISSQGVAPMPSSASPTPTQPTTYSTLRVGSAGTSVTELQKRLAALGYYKGKIDGSYGSITKAAVLAYQKATGLTADGIAGKITQTALYSAPSSSGSVSSAVTGIATATKPVASTQTPTVPTVQSPIIKPSQSNIPTNAQTDTATGGAVIGSSPLKTLAQQNTQNAIPQMTDTATSTPSANYMPSSQGRQIVNIPSNTEQTGIPAKDMSVNMLPPDGETQALPQAGRGVVSGVLNGISPPMPNQPSNVNGAAAGAQAGLEISKPALVQNKSDNNNYSADYGGTNNANGSSNIQTKPETLMPATGGAEGAATGSSIVSTVQNAPTSNDNIYWKSLTQMSFSYDPATDKDYWKAAANAENAIIQSMIGRGGLYSSIARDSVAVKLMGLSIEYEGLAYEKYVDERNFMFQLAQFEQERLTSEWQKAFQIEQFEYEKTQDAWNQNMQLLQYKADREDEMFDRKMQQANNARANAALALQKQQVKAQADAAAAQKKVANDLSAHSNERKAFELMVDRWENLGYADKQVADFFSDYGVKVNDYIEKTGWQNLITTMENQYETEAIALARNAADAGYAAYASDYLASYQRDVTADVPAGSSADNATQNMKTNYYNYRASSLVVDGKAADESHLSAKLEELATAKNEYGELKYRIAMGEYYYDKLYEEIASNLSKIVMSGY